MAKASARMDELARGRVKPNPLPHSIGFLTVCSLVLQAQTSLAAPPRADGSGTWAPIAPVVQLQPASTPSTRDFPGAGVTLTQPVNVLQPIPPAASRVPGLPN